MTKIDTVGAAEAALSAARFLLFKHSDRCPVSHAAFREYEAFVAAHPDVPTGWIDVIGGRTVSQHVAARTGVTHESPQAFWISGGRVAWHASHDAITADALAKSAP